MAAGPQKKDSHGASLPGAGPVAPLLRALPRVVLAGFAGGPWREPALAGAGRAGLAGAGRGADRSSALAGRFGREARSCARRLAAEGLIHNVTSDAHDAEDRPPSLSAELGRAGLRPLAPWLTCEVPEAILAGEELPPRPAVAAVGRPRRLRLLPGRR